MLTPSIGIAAAILQSFIFIGYDLVAKRLQERGVSPIQLSYGLRHAFFPSLVVLACVWDTQAIVALGHDKHALMALAGFILVALIFQWVYFKCLHVSHSLTVASAARRVIGFPLLMVVGLLVNGDKPTWWGIASVMVMMGASFLKPGRTKTDRQQYISSFKTVMLLSIAFVTLVTIKDPLYRLFMQRSPSLILGVAIYMALFSGALHLIHLVRKKRDTDDVPPAMQVNMLWVPILWMLGTIPEAIAFGLLPVYSMIAIGTVSWIAKIGSDLYFKRLAPTLRTATFALLVIISVGLAIMERFAT